MYYNLIVGSILRQVNDIERPTTGATMPDYFESGNCVLPSDIKNDVAGRLKQIKGVKSLELHVKGSDLERGKEFGRLLVALKKRGVKISHEFTIRLEFPRDITREKTLEIVERMPKPVNGSLRIKMEVAKNPAAQKKSA